MNQREVMELIRQAKSLPGLIAALKNSDAIDVATGKPYYILYNVLFPDAFFKLEKGEFLPYVVETFAYANTNNPRTHGYNLVFVKEFAPVPERSFDEMKAEIKMILAANKYSEAIEKFNEGLIDFYKVTYNRENA